MSHFDAAFKDLMYWEGGANYHEVNGDAGGATKYGISLRFLKGLPVEASDIDGDGHVTKNDIALLCKDKARSFYLKHFWIHYQLGNFENPQVASKLFNMFVNMRGRVAGRAAQRALACCGVFGVKEDGYLGPISQAEINQVTCSPSLVAMFLASLRAQQEGVYRLIVAHNPSQEKFLNGWVRRARDERHG
ncbi:hypothetical protein A3765_28420 [Oleiphilus sp. HI0130]|nr:hypothetical protein A3765_29930 [Oleiphilus sp. HI0130]KZZ72477.1 hypothetical protein A3765_28420 [Oleiphilus sp. HI0130]